jgi:hypothetical protein
MARAFVAALISSLAVVAPLAAEDLMLRSLRIETGRTKDGIVRLIGQDHWQQIVVIGETVDGKPRDLTRAAKLSAAPSGIVEIQADGWLIPKADGDTILKATFEGKTAELKVQVARLEQAPAVSFTNQVVPILTKFGCNAGGCHGKSGGQKNFALSLFGFEPAEDYEFLVKEARGGRRILYSAPDSSTLLLKATGAMAHGGGARIRRDSPHYRLLRRWIEQGAPADSPTARSVARIEVSPRQRTLASGEEQQLLVIAHRDDGTTMDVTALAQFETNDRELLEISNNGVMLAGNRTGGAAIMVRYQTHVDVCEVIMPLGKAVTNLPKANNFIDELVFKKLKQLGLPPSELTDDATFLRRATIDIAGRLPTIDETKAFLADKDPQRHEKLVDRLLSSSDYAYYFAGKWGAVLRNRRKDAKDETAPTFAFHNWIKTSLEENKPFDQFVREILTATGKYTETPPAVWYREVRDVPSQVEDAAQLWLGQRMVCARCHHHPNEKWSQQDYYGLAAFFTRVDVKEPPAPKKGKGETKNPAKPPLEVVHKPGVAQAQNPRTKQNVAPTALGAAPLKIAADADPRIPLADWITAPDNPYFARTLANRYWKHFLRRGLVEPEDDMRVTNPPTNPELLDALAKHVIETKFDQKKLIRAICTSATYRLSAVPNLHNEEDRQNYSRFMPRRLIAEVLLDSVDDLTGARTPFKGIPSGARAIHLPDNLFDVYFLSVFGRPDSTSACECERSNDSSLVQWLHLLNSPDLQAKISKGRAAQLVKDKRSHAEKLNELYLLAYSRPVRPDELETLQAYLKQRDANLQRAYEDIIWSLLNTKEFSFNH